MVRASNDETVRQILEMRAKSRHEEASRLYQAKLEGKEEGIIEGEERGIRKRNIEVAKNLLKSNIPVEVIAQSTGLSVEEVDKLR